jgi:TPR repeat protein
LLDDANPDNEVTVIYEKGYDALIQVRYRPETEEDKESNRSLYSIAFTFFKDAADRGHVNGQFVTGLYYLKGKGVEKDVKIGTEYLLSASKGGHEIATDYLRSNCILKSLISEEI